MLALNADCLLRLGKLEEACTAWNAANPKDNHTEIETASQWIYGKESPETRRGRFIKQIREYQKAKSNNKQKPAAPPGPEVRRAAEELIFLDISFDNDIWNVRKRPEYLEHDLKLAEAVLGAGSQDYRAVEFIAKHKGSGSMDEMLKGLLDDETKELSEEAKNMKNATEALGYIGEKAALPASTRVAVKIYRLLLEAKIVTEADLLQMFEGELAARASSAEGDADAALFLAGLYQKTNNPKLAAADESGWNKYKDWRFAVSLLRAKGDKLTIDDPVLVEALAKFAERPQIARMPLACAMRDGKPAAEPLAKYITASFTEMFSYRDGVGPGFAELTKVLNAAKK